MRKAICLAASVALAVGAASAADVVFTTADDISTLQSVIDGCSPGDRVLLGEGLYEPNYTINLVNGVTLAGPSATSCVIRPTGDRRVIYMEGADSCLSNVTITGGKLTVSGYGVGIYMLGGKVDSCIVSNNTATVNSIRGAGIYMENGIVTNCLVTCNVLPKTTSGHLGFGIYMTNGVVACSEISRNSNPSTTGSPYGGGINTWGGTITHCVIKGNSGAVSGGGICIGRYGYAFLDHDVLIDRCLVVANTNRLGSSAAWPNIGGGICVFAQRGGEHGETAIIRHTTIAGNVAPGGAGLGVTQFAPIGGIESCLVADNEQKVATDFAGRPNVFYNGAPSAAKKALIKNNLFGNESAGWGDTDITGDAAFKSLSKGDFHLSATSDAIDAGLVSADVTADLDGYAVTDGKPDIGCYEFDLSREPFSCVLDCSAPSHFVGTTLSLSATPVNAPAGVTLRYTWTVSDGGANTLTASGASASVTIPAAGTYTVSLAVHDDDFGDLLLSEAADTSYPFYVETVYAQPADDLPAIIEALVDGQTLVLGEGTYSIGRLTTLSTGATVTGAGRDATILELAARNARISATHIRAVIEGVTICGGYSTGDTAPVNVEYATIRDSRITACAVVGTKSSAVSTLRILSGGLVERCILDHNTNTTSVGYNSWVYGRASAVEVAGSGTLRNCLVHHNYSDNSCATVKVGSNHYGGGTVENCTIVDNLNDGTTLEAVAVMIAPGGKLLNTIVARNASPNWTSAHTDADSGSGLTPRGCAPSWAVRDGASTGTSSNYTANHNCFGEAAETYGTDCVDGANVLFRNPEDGDWRIRYGSSCRDAGAFQPWMDGAIDLDGNARVFHGTVDLGCYESQVLPRSLLMVK